jgi:hypothetical protein
MADEQATDLERARRPLAYRFALRCDVVYARALAATARRTRSGVEDTAARVAGAEVRLASLEAHLAERGAAPAGDPMAWLVAELELDATQVTFLWAAAAVAADPRLPRMIDDLGRTRGKGLNPAAFAALYALEPTDAHDLTSWLDDPGNPLVAYGLLVAIDDEQPSSVRALTVPGRVRAHLRGEGRPAPPLAPLRVDQPPLHDDAQRAALAQLYRVLRDPDDVLVIVEGPLGSGRRTAVAQVAAGRRLIALDAAQVERRRAGAALVALRRETLLTGALPVIANVDAWRPTEPGARHDVDLARVLDGWDVPVVVTASVPGYDLGARRATVRVGWPVPAAPVRRALWAYYGSTAGEPPRGDLDGLAHRYRIGAGGIARAVATGRTLLGPDETLAVAHLTEGVRHNIAERMGGLARRVEVTQTWDDLVVADDMRDQQHALLARVRHATQVLERWGYEQKLARGTGVAALFSGPPGTGKSMCAGLIALELGLELYQVDLSQVVSKWVGETEKQLAQVFDAAEEGHALLLFDEADALFGQRSTEIKGAVDRYANLEVNFLLQRIEAFGGIVILTTNMDTAIDRALKRRLAAHIVFDAPDEDERAALWTRLTGTGKAPLARDVDVDDLARRYPKMTGANIRNAALGAAFLAAAGGLLEITQDCLHRAARVEYRAMGHVLADTPLGGRSPRR